MLPVLSEFEERYYVGLYMIGVFPDIEGLVPTLYGRPAEVVDKGFFKLILELRE